MFSSPLPSLVRTKKMLGETKSRALVVNILTDMALSYNVGANMTPNQVADLTDDILNDYWMLKIDDLKLCFKYASKERYGKIYRMDGSVVLSWLEKYLNDRLNEADEISHNEHMATKIENRMPIAEDVYKSFDKRNYR